MTANLLGLLLMLMFQDTETPALFGPGEIRGSVISKTCPEISGIVASRHYPGVLWVHNDSGSGPEVMALDKEGVLRATFTLKNAKARDWEDIAIGPSPAVGVDYLYVADTGNNDAHDGKPHKFVRVYRFTEPAVNLAGESIRADVTEVETLKLTYPDMAHDVEGLLLDPWDGGLYFFSKRDPRCRVYRLNNAQTASGEAVLEFLGELPHFMITAADISADGRQILMKDYKAVWYWRRQTGESLLHALQKPATRLTGYIVEPQGEALTFDPQGKGFYTLSEARKKATPLYYYPNLQAD